MQEMIDDKEKNKSTSGDKTYAPVKNKQRNRDDERHKQSLRRQKQAARERILQ